MLNLSNFLFEPRNIEYNLNTETDCHYTADILKRKLLLQISEFLEMFLGRKLALKFSSEIFDLNEFYLVKNAFSSENFSPSEGYFLYSIFDFVPPNLELLGAAKSAPQPTLGGGGGQAPPPCPPNWESLVCPRTPPPFQWWGSDSPPPTKSGLGAFALPAPPMSTPGEWLKPISNPLFGKQSGFFWPFFGAERCRKKDYGPKCPKKA